MSTIVNHALTLRLQWGENPTRELVLPIEYRKGSYAGRYELYLDDVHIGWVVRSDREWHAFVSSTQIGGYDNITAGIGRTRFEAVEEVVARLREYARTNVLASRSEAAYA